MERKIIPESENKLIILYCISSLEAVTSSQLLQFLSAVCAMDYFTMQLNIIDLEDTGKICTMAHPAGGLYMLTESGRFALETFAHKIPVSRRNRIDEAAPQWKEAFVAQQLCPANIIPGDEGSHILSLRLLERRETVMDIVVRLARGEKVPTFIETRWQKAASRIYDAIIMTLTEGFDEGTAVKKDTVSPYIHSAGEGQWLVTLTDDDSTPGFSVMLPVPDINLGEYMAQKWKTAWERLKAITITALEEADITGR